MFLTLQLKKINFVEIVCGWWWDILKKKKNIGEKPLSQSMSGIWLPYDTLPFIAIL